MQQEAVLMSMLSRMQNMVQLTIQQSIGALLPQLTHAASGGGAGPPGRLLLAAAPMAPRAEDEQLQGGGVGVAGGSPPTPSVPPLQL